MFTWISKMLSDGNGVPDEARVGYVVSMAAYIGFWAWWMATGHAWEPVGYCGGIAALTTSYGATIRIRKDG